MPPKAKQPTPAPKPSPKGKKPPPAMVNRQAMGTYQGKPISRSSGLYSKVKKEPEQEEAKKPTPKSKQPAAPPLSKPVELNKIAPGLSALKVKIAELIPDPNNARLHPERNLEAIKDSLRLYGQVKPIVVRKQTKVVVAGNGTMEAAKALGWTEIAANFVEMSDLEAAGFGLADNRSAELAKWDFEVVSRLQKLMGESEHAAVGWSSDELEVLRNASFLDAAKAGQQAASGVLREKFLLAPFSVLDARRGEWQERKQAWLAFGLKSEVGRGENLLKMSDTALQPDPQKRVRAKFGETFGSGAPGDLARGFDIEKTLNKIYDGGDCWQGSGTSIFDPVLTEVAYTWFSPADGSILDPFAGGSVRGVVAAKLGRTYFGMDLSQIQIEANEQQRKDLLTKAEAERVKWKCGDSRGISEAVGKLKFDLLFTCPPYADLEVYSDNPNDISTMKYSEFIEAYEEIIANACSHLRNNRFAVIVVGDVRDKKTGLYRDFPGATIEAFVKAGLSLYNEAILVTSVGSLSIRVGRQFAGARKLGKTHQNVLVFVKGDPAEAAKACGDVEVAEMPEAAEELGIAD